MKIKKFSREDAVHLRVQGHAYESIARELGCSVAWCKKQLVGVARGLGANVDVTKLEAIAILEEALAKVRLL